jgi:hypothetical protein
VQLAEINLCSSLRIRLLLLLFGLVCFGERGSDNEREGNGGFGVNLIRSQQ